MRKTIYAVTVVVLASLISSPAYAQDYRAEIIQHIVDPCLLHSANRSGLVEKLGREQTLALMKIMTPDMVEKSVKAALPMVMGKSYGDRMTIYKFSAAICIGASDKAAPKR